MTIDLPPRRDDHTVVPLGAGITAHIRLHVDPTDLGSHLAAVGSDDQAAVLSGFALALEETLDSFHRGQQISWIARSLQHGPHRDRLPEVLRLLDDLAAMLGPPPGLS